MNKEELQHLQAYSDVLCDGLTTISVLSKFLEAEIRDTRHYVKFFKEHVDEIKSLQNTSKNH